MAIANPFIITKPAGENNQVQINSAGSFGASANLTYNVDNDLVLSSGSIGIQGEFDGFASGSGMAFDWNAGTSKIVCLGNDASTVGGFKIDIAESDMGSSSTALEVNNTSQVIAHGGALCTKGVYDDSLGGDLFGALDWLDAGVNEGARLITTGSATAIGTFSVRARSTDGNPAGVNTLLIASNQNATFSGTVTQNSDQKLKTDIVNIGEMTNIIKSLRPITFKRLSQPADDNKTSAKYYGFIAQEVNEILPDLVHTNIDTDFDGSDKGTKTLALSYSELIPILTKAIQELEARITALE